jgi:hypothetical protein
MLLLLGGCICGKTTYFRKVDVDIDGTVIRGKYPVSESIAKDVDCSRFDYDHAGKLLKINYLRATMSNLFPNGYLPYGATQVRFQYSDVSEKRTFLNSKGNVIGSQVSELRNSQPTSISIYNATGRLDERYLLIRNEKGQVSRKIFLSENGERISNADGIYEERYEYDAKNNKREIRLYASDGRLKEDETFGIAIIQKEYDDYGNVVEMRSYGADGNPKEDKIWGYALRCSRYDEKGNVIEERYYGIDGKLKERLGGVAIERIKYNDRGDRVETRWYGTNEQLTAIARTTYDYEQNRMERRYYGSDETLVEDSNGIAIMVAQHDSDGNVKEVRYLGIDGQLKDNNRGFAIIRYEFDQEGKETKAIYLDKIGRVTKEDRRE